ncbi:MAG: NAD(P)H-dependent oxidoreductase [Bacteroidales bacterium]
MNQLIIYANHNNGSFNHAVLESVMNKYLSLGHEVVVRNLYKQNWNPVLTTEDLAAIHEGKMPSDIENEQKFIAWADMLTVIYPVWWTGMPAILKGYFDRVFSFGFAYGMTDKGIEGFLRGKKVLLLSSTGQPREVYEASGMYKAMNMTTDRGIFEFCAMDVIAHIYFPSIQTVSELIRKEYIESVHTFLDKYFRVNGKNHSYADTVVTFENA